MSLKKFNEFMRIDEAANFLGVVKNTLRNWEKSGKLMPYIHPMNSSRLYKKEDLHKILHDLSHSRDLIKEEDENTKDN